MLCEFYNFQLMQTMRRLFVLKHSSKLKLEYVISQLNCTNIYNINANKHKTL